ncbi:hypothetical protein SDC9_168389 [bioreactor metagenome]|uniref:Uncharacterized protein n=1 Tax=bioreactor metagenome TaxID=1076179 RepID=A0A645G514_9ZZZZ
MCQVPCCFQSLVDGIKVCFQTQCMVVNSYIMMSIVDQIHTPGADTLLLFAKDSFIGLLRGHTGYIDAVNIDVIGKYIFISFYFLCDLAVTKGPYREKNR